MMYSKDSFIKEKKKIIKEKNEYLQENKEYIKNKNYNNLDILEKYISLYPKDSQLFLKQTEHNYDYFYKLYRHLQQNYFAKKFKIKLFNPNSKLKNNSDKYFIFRPWENEPNSQYYNHSILLKKENNTIHLYDTLLYPTTIVNDKGKKKIMKDKNKQPIENIKTKQYVFDGIKRFVKKNNINAINIKESDFLQQSKKHISKTQKSIAGCFEMCLYAYFVFKQINEVNKQLQKKDIINKTNMKLWNFSKMIKLQIKGNGTKDKSIFDDAIMEIEKIFKSNK